MHTFQENFIINCLDSMEKILSDADALESAMKNFIQNKGDLPRYHSNSRIIDAKEWLDSEKRAFNAAMFEATASSTQSLCHDEEQLKEASMATNQLLECYIPKITANTTPNHRLHSVKENISRVKKNEFHCIIEKDATLKIHAYSPYSFFTPIAITLAIGAATTAALILASP